MRHRAVLCAGALPELVIPSHHEHWCEMISHKKGRASALHVTATSSNLVMKRIHRLILHVIVGMSFNPKLAQQQE